MNIKLRRAASHLKVFRRNAYDWGARLVGLGTPRRLTPPPPRPCTRADLKKVVEITLEVYWGGQEPAIEDTLDVAIPIDELATFREEDYYYLYPDFEESSYYSRRVNGTPYFCDNEACPSRNWAEGAADFRTEREALSHLG